MQEFQKNVQTIVNEYDNLKRYLQLTRECRKRIKSLSDAIMEYMQNANIRRCRWGNVALTIDEKQRLPPLTAKTLAQKVQEQFKITGAEWEHFMTSVQHEREENKTVIRSLAHKNADKVFEDQSTTAPKVIGPGIPLPEPVAQKPITMASTVNALYSS